MKKNILYIILFFLSMSFYTHSSFADSCSQACRIKDTPAPVLTQYIKENRKIIQNISWELTWWWKPSIRSWVQAYNKVIDWNDYSVWFDYFKLNIQWEIPYPIRRDLKLLEKEWDYINNFLKNLISWGYVSSPIKNACNGVTNCSLNGIAWDVIWEVLKNHNNILEYYKLSILWRESESQKQFFFVENNFKGEFYNYYNKYTISDCSECKWEFKEKIQKAITTISQKDKAGKDGIEEWKKAWQLLIGTRSLATEYAELERSLLESELAKQWISGNNWKSVLKNLDDYNNNWYSADNNALSNSFWTFTNNTDTTGAKKLVSNFQDSLKQIFEKVKGLSTGEKSTVPISMVSQIERKVKSSSDIMQDVDTLYQRELPFTATQDLNSEKLQARILQMHIDLSQAINILDKTIPLSEKVCNDQDRWNGKCRY